MDQYTVRLDMLRLPTGDDNSRAITIATALIHICGLVKIWDEPKHGHRLFYVKAIPQDVPQAGVYWIKVD